MSSSHDAQPTGSPSAGLVTPSSCTPAKARPEAAKTFNPQAPASRPSDLFHSSSATAEVLATTTPLPSPSGCPPSKSPACSPDQPPRPSRPATSDNVSPDAKCASDNLELAPVPQLAQASAPTTTQRTTTPTHTPHGMAASTTTFPYKWNGRSIMGYNKTLNFS